MTRLVRLSTLLLLGLALSLSGAAPAAADDKKSDNDADALVGRPAPNFEADFAVSGKPVSLADLKGKVVLLDFWAVWCGPCVSTFPHLREWNDEYKAKGLEVVGLTSYYQRFGFDTKAGDLIKAPTKLSKTEEREMLKDFAVHHKLGYRVMTLPKEEMEKVSEKYGIEGIPHVVLIDRKGVVRMVKVGSGEANAKALGKMIEELVADKN